MILRLGASRARRALRRPAARVAVTALIAGALALGSSAAASTADAPASTPADTTTTAGQATPGTNLLANPQGTVGDTSAKGWDAVTIPGWQVQAGLPTVVGYDTKGFAQATGTWPASRGNLFVGGAGGTAELTQDVPVKAAGSLDYTVAAWLGGTSTSDAKVTVSFLNASNQVKGTAAIGPLGTQATSVLASRTATGAVPACTTHAEVTITLATTLTNDNGPDAPKTGYNYAAAGDLSLSISQPGPQARPGHPARLDGPQLPACLPVLLREPGLQPGHRQPQASALPQ